MKEYRKALLRKIHRIFSSGYYPALLGIQGLGKHQLIVNYAMNHKKKCVALVDGFPDKENCIYYLDQYSDTDYLKKLTDYLMKNQNYNVCFLCEKELPEVFYQLYLTKIKVIAAPELLLTKQECKMLLNCEFNDEAHVDELYMYSEGNLFALSAALYGKKNCSTLYWKTYLDHCHSLLTQEEIAVMETVNQIGDLEKCSMLECLHLNFEVLDKLVMIGMLKENEGILSVPFYFQASIKKDSQINTVLFEYYIKNNRLVKAWEIANQQQRQEMLENYGTSLVLMMRDEQLNQIKETDASFLIKILILFRLNKVQEINQMLHQQQEKTADYCLGLLLSGSFSINIREWIELVHSLKIKINIPVSLFLNGFMKNNLWFPWICRGSQLQKDFLSCLDADTKRWFELVNVEIAMERGNLRLCETLLDKVKVQKKDSIEFQFIVYALSVRCSLCEGYKEDLTKIPRSLKQEILLRDDQITQAYKMLMLERMLVINDPVRLAEYYAFIQPIRNPYFHLYYVTLLYRLKFYEKAMLQIKKSIAAYAYHDYMISHFKYIYALCFYQLHQETKALKLLSESLSFNGPLRFSSYYCFFGEDTINLMNIYIRFLDEGIGRKKTYRKAMDLLNPDTQQYRSYIQSILNRSRLLIDGDSKESAFAILTPQEMLVLNSISHGETNMQIAEKLNIKIPTVKTHISNLFSKLGVKNRSSAISEARKRGFI